MLIVWLPTRPGWPEIVKPRFLPQILGLLHPWISGCIGRVLSSLYLQWLHFMTWHVNCKAHKFYAQVCFPLCRRMMVGFVICTGERSLLPHFGCIHSRRCYRCTHESWQGRSIWIMPWGSPENIVKGPGPGAVVKTCRKWVCFLWATVFTSPRVSLSKTFCLSVLWSWADKGLIVTAGRNTCPVEEVMKSSAETAAMWFVSSWPRWVTVMTVLWFALAQCFVFMHSCALREHVACGLYFGPAESATQNHKFAYGSYAIFKLPGCLAWPSVQQLPCSLEASESSLRCVVSVRTTSTFSLSKRLVKWWWWCWWWWWWCVLARAFCTEALSSLLWDVMQSNQHRSRQGKPV